MKTPICDFVENYAREGKMRLHMPGHKGIPFLGVEHRDITEVDGADVLYSADGIIAESERYAAELFGSGRTKYSTEGSSLCIRAMVYLIALQAKKVGKRPLILAARNAHKTFLSALALTDADVEWIYPTDEDNLISCRVSASRLEKKLDSMSVLPSAVYLTSPDYLGFTSDIAAIAKVCHKREILLAVDNAHGAYLKFLPSSRHPIDLGADICCDSAHKTLPVLTGGAYLHISKNAPKLFFDMAEQAMALFASTSPSYLILQSLDRANLYLCDDYKRCLAQTAARVQELKLSLIEKGFSLLGDEEMKLCINAKKYGYFGFEFADYLSENGIVCEFYDRDFVVMMFTPEIGQEEIDELEKALLSLPQKAEIDEKAPLAGAPERVMSVREATLSPSCEVDVKNALGRVLAVASVSCPPAIPVVVCGELIDERAVSCFEYYGIMQCRVVE
ncbi:MAG: PLP-dependent transferase [Clostridia bacterium]|nr:PLP-dependent transferase [Clostridia bacterium]